MKLRTKLKQIPKQYEFHDEKCPHCNGRLTMELYCYGCGSQWCRADIETQEKEDE